MMVKGNTRVGTITQFGGGGGGVCVCVCGEGGHLDTPVGIF